MLIVVQLCKYAKMDQILHFEQINILLQQLCLNGAAKDTKYCFLSPVFIYYSILISFVIFFKLISITILPVLFGYAMYTCYVPCTVLNT